ncbi:MAG: hypothetical protein KAU50_02880, partial [Candidatus Marinimicrobia bacterium]|nr:hypothetical protein [Candidatus Neomarinimicrobiota bacterium]
SLAIGLSAAGTLFAQIEFHGESYPLIRMTTEEPRFLDLPHRFVTINGMRRGDNVSMYFSTAMEYRIGRDSLTLDLREAYAEVLTDLGEFRFGKQIVSWGAADGNNPTDNVNPYDMYYLFIPGTERKKGTVMASANLYLGNYQLEAVFTPVFQPSRLPLNEQDFPIFEDAPFTIDIDKEVRPERELVNSEFGGRVSLPFNLFDLSISYFSGYDRMFTPCLSMLLGAEGPYFILDSLVYHHTNVFGGDLVTFIGDWAVRAEGAYFLTEDREGNSSLIRNPYLQYVLQLDRMEDESSYVLQYLGSYITGIDGDDLITPLGVISEKENEKDNLSARMGMPFAAIARNAIMVSASRSFADHRYEVRANTLYDLDNGGWMIGGGVTVTLEDAFDLELGLTQLGGDSDSRLYQMRDFSHLSLSLKYSF